MECDKEKLVIKSNEKGKMECDILKAAIKCDRKRKIKNSCFRQCPICKSPFWKKKDLEEHIRVFALEKIEISINPLKI